MCIFFVSTSCFHFESRKHSFCRSLTLASRGNAIPLQGTGFPNSFIQVWLVLAEILEFGIWHWILMFVNIGLWILMLALLETVVKPVEITVVNVMF